MTKLEKNTYMRAYMKRNRLRLRKSLYKNQRKWRDKRYAELKDFFGNKCAHCGLSDLRVLQLDHIYNDGNKDKVYSGAGLGVLLKRIKLIRENPTEARRRFQLLCANCNWIKYLEHGKE